MSPADGDRGVWLMMMTEEELDGDAAVYAEHANRLLALAAALAGPSAADDIVSAAVTRVIASPAWRSVENRGAYLTRAVVNEVQSSYRSAMRRAARERRLAPPEATRSAPDPVPELMAALAKLPVRQRAVIFLTYWADMTPAAVAAELDIGEGSVRQHLARARRSLRKTLQ